MAHVPRWAVLLGALALAACGADSGDASAGGGGTTVVATGGGGAGSGGGGGHSTSPCEGYSEQPSTQSVELTLTNAGAVDRFLLVAAYECDAKQIERLGDSGYEPVVQSVGFQCGCECAGPPSAGPRTLLRIAPGASTTEAWDAREMSVCVETIDCTDGTPSWTTTVEHGFPGPAPSGEYRITYQLFETVPEHCSEVAEGYECAAPYEDVGCAGELTAVASFTLPDSGDVTTEVTID